MAQLKTRLSKKAHRVEVKLRVVVRLPCVAYIRSSGIRHISVVSPVHLMRNQEKTLDGNRQWLDVMVITKLITYYLCVTIPLVYVSLMTVGHKYLLFLQLRQIKKGPHKFTLQALNRSLILTYSQRCLTLNLDFRRVFTHIFVCWVEKGHTSGRFLHKYVLFVNINMHCLTDPMTNAQSFESGRKGFFFFPSVANMEANLIFCKLLKEIANITKPSFHKETLPHSITHHRTTNGPSVHSSHSNSVNLIRKNLAKLKLNSYKWRPSKSNLAFPTHLVLRGGGTWRICVDYRALNSATKPNRYPIPHIHGVTAMIQDVWFY